MFQMITSLQVHTYKSFCDVNMVALGIYHSVQANGHCLKNMDTYIDGN
jgi:precorrin isomerase